MFTESLAGFFDTADFGTSAVYDSKKKVKGIFDNADLGALGVAGTNPIFHCAAADLDANPTGKTLVIAGTTYKIRDIQPQDNGAVVTLQLELQ